MKNLIGYEHQKEQLLQNTRAFVQGKPANHVLLVGARGQILCGQGTRQ